MGYSHFSLRGLQSQHAEPKKSGNQSFAAESGFRCCPRAAFTRLVRDEGQPLHGWLVNGRKLKPVSNGLFFRLSATKAKLLHMNCQIGGLNQPYNGWPELGRSRVNAAGSET
jgi:hypothetical protein